MAELQAVTDYPAITLLAAGDHDTERLHLQLHALARTARRRLADEFGSDDPQVAAFGRRITEQIDAVELRDEPAVAIFVSPGVARWHPLTEPVEERVIIDDTFATRDLVHGLLRGTKTYALHLTAGTTRLFAGTGHRFVEVRTEDLPFASHAVERAGPAQRHQFREPSDARDRELARYVRNLDDALHPILHAEPHAVVLIGATRRMATFESNSRHRNLVAAKLPWGGRDLDAAQVEQQTATTIDRLTDERTTTALTAVGAAIKAGALIRGLQDCWTTAAHGQAELLVVEHGYSAAGTVDRATSTITLSEDREAPDVIDDLVDDLIEKVISRRGRVVIVADGALHEHDGVAVCARR